MASLADKNMSGESSHSKGCKAVIADTLSVVHVVAAPLVVVKVRGRE
jgi:hypothetical protein